MTIDPVTIFLVGLGLAGVALSILDARRQAARRRRWRAEHAALLRLLRDHEQEER